MFKSLTVVIVLAAVAALTGPVLAKRGAPKIAKPVISGDVEYRAVHDRYTEKGKPGGIRAFVEARDVKTKKALWRVKVYDIRYRPALETDVQDVYIRALTLDKSGLTAVDERGRRFLIDLKMKTVRRLTVRAATPHFKGVELYPVYDKKAKTWKFAMVPGTNRLKRQKEIEVATTIVGLDALKRELAKLAKGEHVFCYGHPVIKTDRLDAKTLKQLKEYCRSMEIKFP